MWKQHTLYPLKILHQTTTMFTKHLLMQSCIHLKFYIKPQQAEPRLLVVLGCIHLKFYIKPQLVRYNNRLQLSCIHLKFYIKPQLRGF